MDPDRTGADPDGDAGAGPPIGDPIGAAPPREQSALARDAERVRSSVDDIRRVLDEVESGLASLRPTPGASPSRGSWRGLVVLALVGVAAALAAIWLLRPTPAHPAGSSAASPATSAAPTSPAAQASSTVLTGAGRWPADEAAVPARLATTGPGVDAPGSDVVVAAVTPETLAVYQRIWLAEPVSGPVQVSLPDLAAVRAIRLTVGPFGVEGLVGSVDGAPAVIRTRARAWELTRADGRPVQELVVRYRLDKAVIAEAGSASRRALLMVTPLAVTTPASTARTAVRVQNAVVRQAACLAAPAADQLCGSRESGGWVARIPASSTIPLVAFQVDLE